MFSGFWQSLRTFFPTKKQRARHHQTWRTTLRGEFLEQRQLLSANEISYQPSFAGVLIEGTSGIDSVSAWTDAANILHVSMQNATGVKSATFNASSISQVRFVGGDGDDWFLNSTTIGTLAMGEGGNDTIYGGYSGNFLLGGAGNDKLYGNLGVDQLNGDDGHDLLIGGGGKDTLFGGLGNDTISGEGDDDSVYGEDGIDIILGGAGKDYLVGGSGNDFIRGDLGNDELFGGDDDDHLYGEDGIDSINGGLGNDLLSGGAANDTLFGGLGDDVLSGEAGLDNLYGEDGNDTIYGNAGNDYLVGAAGINTLYGGLGDDTLLGGDNDDRLYGEEGIDSITGGLGNDLLAGGYGNDSLFGGVGNDTLSGEGGNDNLYGDDGSDLLAGGEGNDYLVGGAGSNSLFGGIGDDTLTGGDHDDLLFGESGIDWLQGGLGNDQIAGGAENDTLFGGGGNDTLLGEDGDDGLFGEAGVNYLVGGAGNDELVAGNEGNILYGGIGNDSLTGGNGNDQLYGEDGVDSLKGGLGNDQIAGGSGNDTVFGGDGNDTLLGEDGDDNLYGEQGDNYLLGGAGTDYLVAGNSGDVVYGGIGSDTLLGGDGDDQLYGDDGVDILTGGLGNDYLDGGSGNDEAFAGLGNDIVAGGSGDDVLFGNEGADAVVGGAGVDKVYGSAGTDILIGGAQVDQLLGEAGEDILIGGTTEYDGDIIKLNALIAAWSSGLPYQTRVDQIHDDLFAAHLELEHSVFDDGISDTLTGGADQDWFFQTGLMPTYLPSDVQPYEPMDDGHGHSHALTITHHLPALEGFAFMDSLDKPADRQTTESLNTLVAHSDSASLQREHLSLFQLVRYSDVTHYAVANGGWSNPATWHNGVVPGAGAKVLVPIGVNVQVDGVLAPRIATIRVDGTLSFNTSRNTELKVDTVVVSGTGAFEMGTIANPIARGVTARMLFTDDGAINRTWDPFGISRGLITHGKVTINGSEVTSYVALATPALVGAPTLSLKSIPVGWKVGDTIVLASTVQGPAQNEVRQITAILGNTVLLDRPLSFNHIPSAADLEVHVANVTRNAVIESEATDATRRGHIMFMHNPDVSIGYAGFYGLGRTDKSKAVNDSVVNPDWTLKAGTGTNSRARYAVHFHRTGTSADSDPAVVFGSAVVDSPGWGYVNHSSYVDMSNNVAFDVNGAAFATEVGNEIGGFYGNMAIGTTGTGAAEATNARESIQDFGFQGDGFWFQGAGVSVIGNISAGNQENAFIYFTRGLIEGGVRQEFSTANLTDPAIANGAAKIAVSLVPIKAFSNNVGYASHFGLQTRYHLENATHGKQSIAENSIFWNNETGIYMGYTHNTLIRNSKVLTANVPQPYSGITGNTATKNNVYENLTISGYFAGIEPARKGSTIIIGGTYNNVQDILIYTAVLEERNILIDGVPADTTIATVVDTHEFGGSGSTFFVKDRILLNFGPYPNQRLYFATQAGSYVPFPTSRPDVPAQYIGLSNQQLWNQFGLALGGAVLPINTYTAPGIVGYIAPLV